MKHQSHQSLNHLHQPLEKPHDQIDRSLLFSFHLKEYDKENVVDADFEDVKEKEEDKEKSA